MLEKDKPQKNSEGKRQAVYIIVEFQSTPKPKPKPKSKTK